MEATLVPDWFLGVMVVLFVLSAAFYDGTEGRRHD